MRAWLLFSLSLSLAGCVKDYQQPALNEPHALLKLRRVLHIMPGDHRRLRVFVDDEQLLHLSEPARAAPAETTATRVRPGVSALSFEMTFWHTEMQMVSETYTEQVPYTDTETYTDSSCSTPQVLTCTRTRTVTKYRSETKTRWVVKPVDVVDDRCNRSAVLALEPGHTYAVQYTYTGASRCGITCLEQFAADTPEGSEFRPCRVPGSASGTRSATTASLIP